MGLGTSKEVHDSLEHDRSRCSISAEGKQCWYPPNGSHGMCTSHALISNAYALCSDGKSTLKVIEESHLLSNRSDAHDAKFLSPCLRKKPTEE